jgi:hypothetical protein
MYRFPNACFNAAKAGSQCVVKCRHSLRVDIIRRDDKMEPACDQVDFGIDGGR